jgi:hypothetical protein
MIAGGEVDMLVALLHDPRLIYSDESGRALCFYELMRVWEFCISISVSFS